jgi:hypothetical protein
MKSEVGAAVDGAFGIKSEEMPPPVGAEAQRSGAEKGGKKSPPATAILLDLADDAGLFHSPEGEVYATVTEGERKATHRLNSRTFKQWLCRRYYLLTDGAPSDKALGEVINILEARALYDGPEVPVFLRVAFWEGVYYLNLARADGAVVAVTATGWTIVNDPPVRFYQPASMLPLPLPEPGGHIDELRPFVNLKDDTSFILLVSWLVAALWHRGPFPVLAISGEFGASKSTLSKICRALIDPSFAGMRQPPKDARDIMIAARNSWLLAFDNLSGLDAWLSNAMCSLATGGGFATRKLTTDADEMLFEATRPILLNGINEIATRADLADRAVLLDLPAISETKRRAEEDFWADFNGTCPRILAALLDGVSAVVRDLPHVKLAKMPRMADFAKVGTAAEAAFGWEAGTFMAAYTGNRDSTVLSVVENDLVAKAVLDFLRAFPSHVWTGTPTALHEKLGERVPEMARRSGGSWPQNAAVLTTRLKLVQANLRRCHVEIEWGRTSGERAVTLTLNEPTTANAMNTEPATPSITPKISYRSGHGHFATSGFILRTPSMVDGDDDAMPPDDGRDDGAGQPSIAPKRANLIGKYGGSDDDDDGDDDSASPPHDADAGQFEELL